MAYNSNKSVCRTRVRCRTRVLEFIKMMGGLKMAIISHKKVRCAHIYFEIEKHLISSTVNTYL